MQCLRNHIDFCYDSIKTWEKDLQTKKVSSRNDRNPPKNKEKESDLWLIHVSAEVVLWKKRKESILQVQMSDTIWKMISLDSYSLRI